MKKISTYLRHATCLMLLHVGWAQAQVPAPFVPAQPVLQLPATPLWTVGAQVRPRAEIREGLGNPYTITNNPAPASFISMRTNLNFGFRWDKLNFLMDLRDVRVWGQDASSINNADGNKLFLHQAWGEFILATTADTNCKLKIDNLSLKVGRQEINYDDARLLGNLDWLQQGRRHDAAILKFFHRGYQVDLGGAYNQNSDAFGTTNNSYVPGNVPSTYQNSNGVQVAVQPGTVPLALNTATGVVTPQYSANPSTNGMNQMYKTFLYLYAARRFEQTRISILAFNDNFGQYTTETIGIGGGTMLVRRYNNGPAVNSRFTVGGQVSTQIGNSSEGVKITANAGGYYQFGKNRDGQNLSAAHFFGYGLAAIGKWSFGPGFEHLSGNNQINNSVDVSTNTDNRFDPLYGTPHRWWGYMDYYYVGTGSPKAGLNNLYVRGRYDAKNLFITLDVHQFYLANALKDPRMSGSQAASYDLGQEIDLVLNYQINKFTNVEAGYCMYIATPTTELAKLNSTGTTRQFNHWGYVQLNIRPEFLFQKPVPVTN